MANDTMPDAVPVPERGFLQETPEGGAEFTTAFRGGFGGAPSAPAESTSPGVQVADASEAMRELEALAGGRVDDTYRDVLSKRSGDENLKWLEDYATNNGLVEFGEDPIPQEAKQSEWWPGTGIPGGAYTKAAKTVAGDIFGGLVTEGASTYLGHGLKGIENTLNGISSATGYLSGWLEKNGYGIPGGVQVTDPETGAFDPKLLSSEEFKQFQERGGTSDISIPGSGLADQNETVTGNLVGGMVQFLTGLGLIGKMTGGLSTANNAAGVAKRIGQFALADLAAWDGQEGNLANFIQQYPSLQNPVTEWLATDEETPELAGRLKNAIAAAPLNVGGEVVLQWLKGIKEVRKLKALTQSDTVEEAVGKIETGQASLQRPTVEQILGDPNQDLVRRAERMIAPVETGAPDHVAAKSLLPESTRAPDIQPGMVRVYRAEAKGSSAPIGPDVTNDLSKAQADLKAMGGLEGGNQVAYWDIPQDRAAELAKQMQAPQGASSLDMSQAARTKRAREQGFDTDTVWYHGTPADHFDEFSIGNSTQSSISMTTNRSIARDFAGKGGRIMGLFVRVKNPFYWDVSDLDGSWKRASEVMPSITREGEIPIKQRAAFEQALRAAGYDALDIGSKGYIDERAVVDPINIRSVDAAFDPANSGASIIQDRPPSSSQPQGPSSGPFSSEVVINWSRIDTIDDVKRTIGMMADSFPDEIKAAQRGKVSNAETARLAGDENAWKLLLGERQGNLPNAHEQLAMRKLWASSGQKLLETAKLAATGGDAEMYAFRKMLAIHNTIQKEVMGVRTETARALQQWKMPAGPEATQMAQMKLLLDSQGGGMNVTKDLAQKVAILADNPQALDAFARKAAGSKTLAAVREYWINALLSGPKTHIVNAMSNGLVFANTLTERMIAGQISSVMSPVDGVRTGEALYMMMGAKASFGDALSAAWRVMRTGQSTYARELGIPGHELSPYTPAISAEAFDVKGSHLAKGIDMLGSVIRVPGTAMMAADEFFKIINSRSEIWAQALRMASEEVERGKIPKEGLKARIAEIVENPPEDIRLKAADMAAYNTFTSEPDAITKKLLEIRNAIPGAVIVMPFVNTPANILKYSFERTPLAPLVGRYRADMAAGGARRDLALAKLGLGSIVMSVAYDLAMDGHLSGSGPAGDKNFRERQALTRGGWQQYSARIMTGQDADGNPTYRYFAYNRLDPIGLYTGMAADIADMARNLDFEDASARQTFEQIVIAATFSAAEGMMDKTYLSGFAGFVDAIRNADQDAYRFVRRLSGSMVPAIVAEGARQVDPYAKHTSDMISQLKSRIPYLSEDVPPRLDMWGEPIGYQSGLGMAYDVMSPIYSKSTGKAAPIDREFFKLNYFPTDTVSMSVKGDADGQTLNMNLRNYPEVINEFKVAAGKTPASKLLEDNEDDMLSRKGVYKSYVKVLYGLEDRTMKEALNDLVTGKLGELSLEYQAGSTEDKVDMIQDIMRAYRGAARAQILREHPEIQDMRNRIPTRESGGAEAPF